jgi:hypothetical protein
MDCFHAIVDEISSSPATELCAGASSIGVVDEAAVSEPDFHTTDEVAHRRLAAGQPFARRGYEFGTCGDGEHEILGAGSAGRVCAVAVYAC